MKVIVLLLVVLVSSSTFALPKRRQVEDEQPQVENEQPQQENGQGEGEDEATFEEQLEQGKDACERFLKCEEPTMEEAPPAKRQEAVEEDKAVCERLIEKAEEELLEEAERTVNDEDENEGELEEIFDKLESCKARSELDCDAGSSKTRSFRRMLRNLEGDECLEALEKVRKLKDDGEGKCECESGEGKSGGKGRLGSKGSDRKRPEKEGGDRQRLGEEGGDREKQGEEGADRQGDDAGIKDREDMLRLLRLLKSK